MTRSEIQTKTDLVLLIFVLSLIIGGAPNYARAGEDPGELFNYSFAIWLGSGVYKVQDADKRFAVLRVPAALTLRPANLEKGALIDRLGFRLLLPAAIGFEEETDRINTLYDIGLTFGFSESISIWRVDLDRVGIDYRWGDQGFKGIGFNLGFPF